MYSNYQSTPTRPWSHRLAQILQLSPHSSYYNSLLSPSTHRSGEIWKHIFSVSVYHDLKSFESTRVWKNNGRFIRLERFGLSGVILYEILVEDERSGDSRPGIDIEEVFGSEGADYEDGMTITQLLDLTKAKLVYFPAYACTSFVVGQVMHVFLTDARHVRLHQARDGYFVHLPTTTNTYPSGTLHRNHVIPLVKINQNSSGTDSDSELFDDEFDSSVDSFGPQTPPRFKTPPIKQYEKYRSSSVEPPDLDKHEEQTVEDDISNVV